MPIVHDLLYTGKLMRKNAGFTLLCVLLIGLGIMMAMALFSLVWNLNLKSPDIDRADRWVTLTLSTPQNPAETDNFFPTDWYEFARDNVESFSVFGAARNRVNVNLNDGEGSRVAIASLIEPSLLQAAGVEPVLGRNLLPEDDRAGTERVALLGHSLWRDHYAGDPDIIGQTRRIGGLPHTIVGVMPPAYGFPLNAELWLPLRLDAGAEPGPGQQNLSLLGVLKEGVSLQQANAEIQGIADAFNTEYADEYPQPLFAFARAYPRLMNFSVMGMVLNVLTLAILLLVAFNLGNLLLYRANERSHELAVRSALGGTRFRVVRVLLLESLLICGLGALLGVLLSTLALDYIGTAMGIAFGGENLPFWMNFSMDGSYVAFILAATLGIWLLSGGLAALRLSTPDVGVLLSAGSKGLSKKGSLRLTRNLVRLEVIIGCFLLIISASIVVVTAMDVRHEFGVASQERFAGEVRVNQDALDLGRVKELARELQQEQLVTTGIADASYSSAAPGHEVLRLPYGVADRTLDSEGAPPQLNVADVAGNYFDFLEVPLVAGRAFSAGDMADSQPVAVVDERLADALWPGESVVGKRLQLRPEDDGPWVEIVGVVESVHQAYDPVAGRPSLLTLYRPFTQGESTRFTSLIRSDLPAQQAFERLRASVARASGDLAIFRLDTLQDHMMINSRPFLLLRNIFICITVLLVLLIGSVIYGLIARSFLNRADEIGLRRALGASNRQALMVFMRETLGILVLGLVVGGLGGILVSGALSAMFPNITLYLPAIGAAGLLFTSLVILAAGYIPASRVLAMEPGDALRYE